jgi:hypothetical protein
MQRKMKNLNIDFMLYILHKNKLKMDHRPKCKMQIIKLIENKIGILEYVMTF